MDNFPEFCEHLHQMRLRFQKWDNCERTVAIYYLMVGLPFANARLLQHALENCIAEVVSAETAALERNANDPAFISGILSEKPHISLSLLMTHLPLLQPGNREAVDTYTKAIRKILSDISSAPVKAFNECVELMSYVFIHPAFEKEQKKSFKNILKQVLQRNSNETYIHSPVNESSDESVSPHSEINVTNGHVLLDSSRLNRRSNSLTPAQTSSHESLVPNTQDIWSSQENLTGLTKQRSYSLSNDQGLPINVSSLQSSSSETRLQDLQTMNNLPTMKSIVSWLKSLRLHKYSWVFNNLTYEQMLNLTEEALQAIGITKGARHKLLLSIGKLKERSSMLSELEVEVMNGGDLLNALKKLKGVLQSPLQVANGEDLPSQFVKVMGKVCTQLLMLRQPTDECLVLFSTLCERAESSESFTEEQKRRLSLWRGQLGRANNVQSYMTHRHHNTSSFRHHNSSQSQYIPSGSTGPSRNKVFSQKSSSYPNVQNNPGAGGHRHSIGTITFSNIWQGPITENFNFTKSDVHHQHHNYQQQNQHHVRFKDTESEEKYRKSSTKCSEIESSLESLCLQMMEHALGP